MTNGNSFNPQDRTILRPQPGGRRSTTEPVDSNNYNQTPRADSLQSSRAQDFFQAPQNLSTEHNRIVLNAAELLSLTTKLRSSISHQNIDLLRQQITAAIQKFSALLLQQGLPQDVVQDSSYAMCTLMDEAILNTPWGAHSSWGTQTLLSQFHGEAWGGENFFVKLERFKSQPSNYLDILEFYYICLSMDLQGRYRVLDHGQTRLEDIREDLYQLIRRQKGSFEKALSLHWLGAQNLRNSLVQYTPWWVIVAVGSVLLLLSFLSFSYFINERSEPVFNQLDQIARESNPYATEYVALVEYTPEFIEIPEDFKIEQRKTSLKELLAPEIAQGLVEVFDREGNVFIRTRGLFVSGSDKVMPEMLQLIDRIGNELNTMQGKILISGHTDNIPIFTLRFPSNSVLSTARAETVKNMLVKIINSEVSFTIEGRADNEPVVKNDSKQNRARNRRIEIIITER